MNKVTIWAIITSILALLLLLNTCRLNRKIDSQSGQITEEQLKNQSLDSVVNTRNQTIYTQEVIIAGNTKVLDDLTDTVFSLRDRDRKNTQTIAYWQGRSNTSIVNTKIPYLDTIRMRRFSDSVSSLCREVIDFYRDSSVLLGTKAKDSTQYYYLTQTILKDGINIDSLSLPDTLSLRFVEHKGNLFRKAKVEVQYFHSNKYVINTGSNSVMYIPKKKSFFTRIVLPFAVGVGTGYFIFKK